MRLVSIPKEKHEAYRLSLIFDCFKWDPQFFDHNTIAKYALVITAEVFLNQHLELTKPLHLTKKCRKYLSRMKNYDADKHVRLMRYDFHPTVEGKWAVSEVNSDAIIRFTPLEWLAEMKTKYFHQRILYR